MFNTYESKLLVSLTEVISEWMNQQSNSGDDWSDNTGWIAGNTPHHMATAAMSVLAGLTESQGHAVLAGYLKTVD